MCQKPVISIQTQVVELHKNFDHCKYSLCLNKQNILGGLSQNCETTYNLTE